MKAASLLLISAVLGVAGCNPAEDKTAKVDIAAEEQAIRAKEAGWLDAYNKHDANGLASQYEDDASLAGYGTELMTDAAARSQRIASLKSSIAAGNCASPDKR